MVSEMQRANFIHLNEFTTDAKWRSFEADVPRSLPLPIAPISRQSTGINKPADQRKSLADKADTSGNEPLSSIVEEDERRNTKSATAYRQEAYAKRDRARNIDPGLLEFTSPDNDAGESDDNSSDEDINIASMSKSQRNALKIIRGAESLPSEGWRSLTRVS